MNHFAGDLIAISDEELGTHVTEQEERTEVVPFALEGKTRHARLLVCPQRNEAFYIITKEVTLSQGSWGSPTSPGLEFITPCENGLTVKLFFPSLASLHSLVSSIWLDSPDTERNPQAFMTDVEPQAKASHLHLLHQVTGTFHRNLSTL